MVKNPLKLNQSDFPKLSRPYFHSQTNTGRTTFLSQFCFRSPRTVPLLILSLFFIAYLFKSISSCHSRWSYYYQHACTSGTKHPWANVAPPNSKRKIAVSMIIDDHFFDPKLRNDTIENKKTYAKRWGYEVVIPNDATLRKLASGRPVAWAKIPLLKKLLETFDYVLMIDADAIILRNDIGLHAAIGQMEKENTSLLISNDMTGPNSGIFIMRRSSWSTEFLDEATKASSFLSKEELVIPLRYENRAFLYMLDAWPTCFHLPRIDTINAPSSPNVEQFRKGVTTVDRCLINRRPRRDTELRHFFRNTGTGFDDLSDAFIGHSAGGQGHAKAESIREMLAIAAKNSKQPRSIW